MYRIRLIQKEYKANKTHPYTNIPSRLHILVAIALLTSSTFLILIHRFTSTIISHFRGNFNWGYCRVKLTSWIYSLSTTVKKQCGYRMIKSLKSYLKSDDYFSMIFYSHVTMGKPGICVNWESIFPKYKISLWPKDTTLLSVLRVHCEVFVINFKIVNDHRRDAFLKKKSPSSLWFSGKIILLSVPRSVFIVSWKYEQQMISYKTIYYYNKNEK